MIYTLCLITYQGFCMQKRFYDLAEAKRYFKSCAYVSEHFEEEDIKRAYIYASCYGSCESWCECVLKG